MKQTYQIVDRNLLGYSGKLYPLDMQIEVRGAAVPEIRAWSNIDENDAASVAKHVIDIITACTRVTSTIATKHYSVKDLYEHDKMTLLLLIHALTFADQKSNNIFITATCSNTMCNKEFDRLAVQPANLIFKTPDEKYEKYIDADNGKFVIQTKSYGTIEYRPTTIGLGNAMLSWIQTFKPAFIRENQAMFRMVQSLVSDWRLANDKYLRKLQVEQYNQMNTDVLSFRTALLDELTIELSTNLEYVCPDCGATFRCPMALDGGYRQLFMPVQSIADELV